MQQCSIPASRSNRLQHVPLIGVLISIDRGAAADNKTRRLLAKCSIIIKLYLWSAYSDKLGISERFPSTNTSDRAYVPKLLPVKHIISQLEGLSIDGIQFDDYQGAWSTWQQHQQEACSCCSDLHRSSKLLRCQVKLKPVWSLARLHKTGHNCLVNWSN